MCTAAAAFSKNQVARLFDNDLYAQWKQATKGYKGKAAIRAWRRYWDKQGQAEEEAMAA